MKSLVSGLFCAENKCVLTNLTEIIDKNTNGFIKEHIKEFGDLKFKKTRVLYKAVQDYPVLVLVGLGPKHFEVNPLEELDEKRENVRTAIASAISTIRSLDIPINEVHLDGCDNPEAVAEGAILSDWRFDELKNENSRRNKLNFFLADKTDQTNYILWQRGVLLSELQNVCRRFQELPANLLTPTIFSEEAKKLCEPLNIKVLVHDRKWAEDKKMGSFLSVTNGSEQPPKFVELHYNNSDEKKPFVFVGKGITFDSGGISIKPAGNMSLMRSDMGGAAVVLCTIAALAKLKANVNIIGLIPLTENLISGKATKPGDVVYAMNGKSIEIDNTDAEGRLILADALCYADEFNPELVVDIATLTGAIKIALGHAATSVYSTNDKYWNLIKDASIETGDRVWKMPLFNSYLNKTKDSHLADLINTTKEPDYGAGSCIAATFLKEFTNCKNWMHLDSSNTKYNSSDIQYISKGMSGRPLRTMVKFIEKFFLQKNI